MHLSSSPRRTLARLATTAMAVALLGPSAMEAAAQTPPPPASSVPPPPISASGPSSVPGITAGPSHSAPSRTASRDTRRWVRAAFEAAHAGEDGRRMRIRATWSCRASGRMTLFIGEEGRWVRRATHRYSTCDPQSHTASMRSDAVPVPSGGASRPVKVLAELQEAGRTSRRIITMRRNAVARAAADMWWIDGDARCSRSYTSGNYGQVVIDVDPSATFGARIGDVVEWQSWMYVYDESLPVAQRGRWVAHAAGTFRYTVNLGYASSGSLLDPWGNQILSLGGTAPGGNSGVQTWNVQNGLWVRPAIAVKYPGRADWNYVAVREGGVSGGWCRFS